MALWVEWRWRRREAYVHQFSPTHPHLQPPPPHSSLTTYSNHTTLTLTLQTQMA